MSSFAELEADLFLAERAFKRVPSDQNKEALAKVKKAIESLDEAKAVIKTATPAVPKKPAAPKAPAAQKAAVAPKAPTVKAPAAKTDTTQKLSITEDSKKN